MKKTLMTDGNKTAVAMADDKDDERALVWQ